MSDMRGKLLSPKIAKKLKFDYQNISRVNHVSSMMTLMLGILEIMNIIFIVFYILMGLEYLSSQVSTDLDMMIYNLVIMYGCCNLPLIISILTMFPIHSILDHSNNKKRRLADWSKYPNQKTIKVRIVTRGDCPELVIHNALFCYEQCMGNFIIEVVTDKALKCQDEELFVAYEEKIKQIIVNKSWCGVNGVKFKGHALAYASMISRDSKDCWVLHLDEETIFTKQTFNEVIFHVITEEGRRVIGEKPLVGQGVILYHKPGSPVMSLSTYVDSIRPFLDVTKYKFAYNFTYMLSSCHGSWLLVPGECEPTFALLSKHESIAEDTAFMCHISDNGYGITFIDSRMYEQSPMSVMDFLKQRARWFKGIYLCWQMTKQRLIVLLVLIMDLIGLLTPLILILMLLWYRTKYTLISYAFLCMLESYKYLLGGMMQFEVKDAMIASILGPFSALCEAVGYLYGAITMYQFDFHVIEKEMSD